MATIVSLQVERAAVDFVEIVSPLTTTVSREIDLGVNYTRDANAFPQRQYPPVFRPPVSLVRSDLEGSGGIYVVGTVASGERYQLGVQRASALQVTNSPMNLYGQTTEAQLLVDSPRPPTSEIETPITIGPTGPTGPVSDFYWGN